MIANGLQYHCTNLFFAFQAFNESMKATDKRMTAERCGYLSLVAIAHKLEEAWICFFPVLPLMYISQYLPTIGKRYYCNTRFFLPTYHLFE